MIARDETIVEVRNVTRTYRMRRGVVRRALDDVSLSIAPGAWTALLGPNGAGKSTLLGILATLDRPQEGGARIFDAAIGVASRAGMRAARARLGVVFQRPGLDPILTVRENLRAQAALHALPAREINERIERVAGACGLTDRLDERVSRLSGGLARRADLARALLSEPELLLLDEPTTGLDLTARGAFLETLIEARRRRPLTIIMNTHAMEEAERADRVVMLDRGRIVADGAPEALRRELGETLIRAESSQRGLLEDAGLDVTSAGDRVVGAGDAARIEQAASALLRDGRPFEVGPPTLGDVYLAGAGRSLAEDDAPAERAVA